MTIEERYIAKKFFRLKALESQGQVFEDFFVSIMTKATQNFRPVRAYGNIGDMKNDEYVSETGTFYQVFAPDDITKTQTIYEAVAKLENDFNGLYEKWNALCEIHTYYFVINDKYKGIAPTIDQKILELKKNPLYEDITIKTFLMQDLQSVFESLDEEKMMDVIGYIPPVSLDMIEYDALSVVVSYLLKTEMPEEWSDNLVVPDFDEKIVFNGLSDVVKAILVEGSYQAGVLERYFNEDPGIRQILQKKFHALYKLSLQKIDDSEENASDSRFFYILKKASPKQTGVFINCVQVLMSYYFSSCDIFEEPQ